MNILVYAPGPDGACLAPRRLPEPWSGCPEPSVPLQRNLPEPAECRSGARWFWARCLTQFVCFSSLKPPQPLRNPPEPAAEPALKCNSAREDPEPAAEPAFFYRCPTPFACFMVSHRDFIILLLTSSVKPYFAAWGLAEGLAWGSLGEPLGF